MVLCSAETGGDEHGTDFVAVESGGVRFVVESWASNMCRGRFGDEVFLFGVAVETRHGAESPRDGRTSSTESLEVAAEPLDVGAPSTEQRNASFCTPPDVLAQVEPIGLERQTAVSGEE